MRKILSLFLLLLFPTIVLADGMVIPSVAFPANVTIPDQRALICFSNGVERLVIETRFAGAGTNFAWIVPFPAKPTIEEATTGLFPTLQYLFRPKIIHDVPKYYQGVLLAMAFLLLIVLMRRTGSTVIEVVVVLFGILLLAAMLLPALGTAGIRSMADGANETVDVLDRQTVGAFETATIQSTNATELRKWLTENEFNLPTNVLPAIDGYVKDGWLFVASKVRRDLPANATNILHPLSFTFKTDKAVYPMRLTGVNSTHVKIELYVFGPGRAEAENFEVERATYANYPPMPSEHHYFSSSVGNPEVLNVLHPIMRKWTGEPMATKLVGDLSAAEMKTDVWIGWNSNGEQGHTLFSQYGAQLTATNWGMGIFGTALTGLFIAASAAHWRIKKTLQVILAAAFTALCITMIIYLSLPEIDARVIRGRAWAHTSYRLSGSLNQITGTNLSEIRQQARKMIASNTAWQNELQGGNIREEDSPGNYTIRDVNGLIEAVIYDGQGAEHVFPY